MEETNASIITAMTPRHAFISYSRRNKRYLDELVATLNTVPDIAELLWFDEQGISVGEKFHPKIQQALQQSPIVILLLSVDFFKL